MSNSFETFWNFFYIVAVAHPANFISINTIE